MVHGEVIFVTVSPNRRHSAMVLKLSRARRNDASLLGDLVVCSPIGQHEVIEADGAFTTKKKQFTAIRFTATQLHDKIVSRQNGLTVNTIPDNTH